MNWEEKRAACIKEVLERDSAELAKRVAVDLARPKDLRMEKRHLIEISGAVSIQDAREMLGCSRTRIFELLKDGKLKPAPSFGRPRRITLDSVRVLLGQDPRTAGLRK